MQVCILTDQRHYGGARWMFLFGGSTDRHGHCMAIWGFIRTCNQSVETLLTDQYVSKLGGPRRYCKQNRTTNTTQPQAVNKGVERVIFFSISISCEYSLPCLCCCCIFSPANLMEKNVGYVCVGVELKAAYISFHPLLLVKCTCNAYFKWI